MKLSEQDIVAAMNVAENDDQRQAVLQLLDEAVDDAMSQVCDARAFGNHGELAARAGALSWARVFRDQVRKSYEAGVRQAMREAEDTLSRGGY